MLLSRQPRAEPSRLAWLNRIPIAVASGRINRNLAHYYYNIFGIGGWSNFTNTCQSSDSRERRNTHIEFLVFLEPPHPLTVVTRYWNDPITDNNSLLSRVDRNGPGQFGFKTYNKAVYKHYTKNINFLLIEKIVMVLFINVILHIILFNVINKVMRFWFFNIYIFYKNVHKLLKYRQKAKNTT